MLHRGLRRIRQSGGFNVCATQLPPVPFLHVFLGGVDIRDGWADFFSLDIGECFAQHSPPPPPPCAGS